VTDDMAQTPSEPVHEQMVNGALKASLRGDTVRRRLPSSAITWEKGKRRVVWWVAIGLEG